MGARVLIAGRFEAGQQVHLFRVKDASVRRHEGGTPVGTVKADESGSVEFSEGVVADGCYVAFGYVDGQPREIQVRGGGTDGVFDQLPIGPDVVRHGDGQVAVGEHRPLVDPRPVADSAPSAARASASRKRAKKPAAKSAKTSAGTKNVKAPAKKSAATSVRKTAGRATAAKKPAAKKTTRKPAAPARS